MLRKQNRQEPIQKYNLFWKKKFMIRLRRQMCGFIRLRAWIGESLAPSLSSPLVAFFGQRMHFGSGKRFSSLISVILSFSVPSSSTYHSQRLSTKENRRFLTHISCFGRTHLFFLDPEFLHDFVIDVASPFPWSGAHLPAHFPSFEGGLMSQLKTFESHTHSLVSEELWESCVIKTTRWSVINAVNWCDWLLETVQIDDFIKGLFSETYRGL